MMVILAGEAERSASCGAERGQASLVGGGGDNDRSTTQARAELVARDNSSARRSVPHTCGGRCASEYEERHVRCSGALHRNRDLRWVTMMISLDLFASLASQPACPQHRAPTIPFCQTVSQQSGSAHPGLKSVPVPCKNLRAAGCSRKKRVILAIPKMDPSPHQASSWSALPGGLQGGWWVWTSPHGTPKNGKKVLTLWLVRASDLEDDPVLTRGIPYGEGTIYSIGWFHIRGRYLTGQDVIPTRDHQRHQWLVVSRVFLEPVSHSY